MVLVLNNLAVAYERQNKYVEAEQTLRQALLIRESAFGTTHPDFVVTASNLAGIAVLKGDLRNALAFSHRTTTAVIEHETIDMAGPQSQSYTGGLFGREFYFRRHVASPCTGKVAPLSSEACNPIH